MKSEWERQDKKIISDIENAFDMANITLMLIKTVLSIIPYELFLGKLVLKRKSICITGKDFPPKICKLSSLQYGDYFFYKVIISRIEKLNRHIQHSHA